MKYFIISALLLLVLSCSNITYKAVHIKTQTIRYTIEDDSLVIKKHFEKNNLAEFPLNKDQIIEFNNIIYEIDVQSLKQSYRNRAVMDGLKISFVFETLNDSTYSQASNCYVEKLGRIIDFVNSLIIDNDLKIMYTEDMKEYIGSEDCE